MFLLFFNLSMLVAGHEKSVASLHSASKSARNHKKFVYSSSVLDRAFVCARYSNAAPHYSS
jgi:hypothetical protein